MINLILAAAVALLTVAVVALFAMMGELAERVEQGVDPDWVDELHGWEPPSLVEYPHALQAATASETTLLLILSTSCETCRHLVRSGLETLAAKHRYVATVISTSSADRAADFRRENPALEKFPVHVDIGGDWCREFLNIDQSPSAVLVEHGVPIRAWSTSSAGALRPLLPPSGSQQIREN